MRRHLLPPTTGGLFVTDFDEDFGTSKIKLKRYIKTLKKGMDESEGTVFYRFFRDLRDIIAQILFFRSVHVFENISQTRVRGGKQTSTTR